MQVHDGQLFVNDRARNEPYIYQAPLYTLPKFTIPKDNVSSTHMAAATGSVFQHSKVIACVQSHSLS